ncbi:hypothetical protein TWF481_010318 [Arthrobotrys musiformis]|uniref:FYVE-type domain-containing protein n=1 Tax=Arthrobotrys musiformis TaxID=47236 RepID=A0AAV9W6F0_9PEZI
MSEPQTIHEATIACSESLKRCLDISRLTRNGWAENRLVDFEIWSAGAGALAGGKPSLDERLASKPEVRDSVVNLLLLLNMFVEDCVEKAKIFSVQCNNAGNEVQEGICDIDKGNEDDSDKLVTSGPEVEAKKDVEMILDQIIGLTIVIRKAGSDARFRKADKFFDPQDSETKNLRSFLELVMYPKGLEQEKQLNAVQLRLIEANLRRRHRFFYAKARSKKPAGWKPDIQAKVVMESHVAPENSPNNGIGVPSNVVPETRGEYSAPEAVKARVTEPTPSTFAPASATAASAVESIVEINTQKPARAAATAISRTTSKITYPRPPPLSPDNKDFKCPCCCQSLPISFAGHAQWKEHLANDILPYTCILPDCAQPSQSYLTRKDWEYHMDTEHGQLWSCFICEQLGEFAEFYEEGGIIHHLRAKHGDAINIDEISMFVSASHRPKPARTLVCPLCPGPEPHEDPIEHVAQCVHDFSLLSLPPHLEDGNKEDYFAIDSEESNLQNTASSSIEERDVEGLPELNYDSGQADGSSWDKLTKSSLKSISQSSPREGSVWILEWASSLETAEKKPKTPRRPRRVKALSRDLWMKDENCTECSLCQRPFTTFRRKHHCRICGQIFCSHCTILVDGGKLSYNGSLRVCNDPCLQTLEQYQGQDGPGSGSKAKPSVKSSRRAPSINAPKSPKGGRSKSGVFDPLAN